MILISESTNYVKKYKCPYCGKSLDRQNLIYHVDRNHEDMLPENYTASRVVFNMINHKEHGNCTECGDITKWDEEKCRYDRICEKPACHTSYLEKVNSRNLNKFGTTNLLTDKRFAEEQQKKMLANRKISGKYRWSNGDIKTYTGSYELKCLKFMDTILHCKSEDVMVPGHSMYYDSEGVTRMYISDIYYIPYNLIIEIKDGGSNPNTRDMKIYRKKQLDKEKAIISQKKYNYLRLTDNNFAQLLEMFALLKFQLMDKPDSNDMIVKINENMFAGIGGMMPPAGCNDIYVTNYMKHNDFTGNDEDRIAVTRDKELNELISFDDNGNLIPINRDEIGENFTVYKVISDSKNSYKKLLEDTINKKQNVNNRYLLETVLGHVLLSEEYMDMDRSLEKMPIYNNWNLIEQIVEATMKSKMSFPSEKDDVEGLKVRLDQDGYFMINNDTGYRCPSLDNFDPDSVDVIAYSKMLK